MILVTLIALKINYDVDTFIEGSYLPLYGVAKMTL